MPAVRGLVFPMLGAMGLAMGLGVVACGVLDKGEPPGDGGAVPVNTGLSKLSSGAPKPALRPMDAQAAASTPPAEPGLNLSEVINRVGREKAAPVAQSQAPSAGLAEAGGGAEAVAAAPPAEEPAVEAQTPEQRVTALAAELRRALAERSSGRPFALAVGLVMLDVIAGVSSETAAGPELAPPQRGVVEALRAMLDGVVKGDGEPAGAAALLDEARHGLSASQAVRITRAVLCHRVMGYGQYQPFGGSSFAAGRENRVLVYVEVENFAHRRAHDGDREAGMRPALPEDAPLWTVELGQELALMHDADGSTQWRRGEETITDVSCNRRRDFYLVQQIDLPTTLSVGRFNLKVTVRDKTNGSIDEAILPITIVADPQTALRGPTPPVSKPGGTRPPAAERR